MWVSVDRLAGVVLDASIAATALLSVIAMVMLSCRQPARRIRLARAAILCSLAMIPLVALSPLPRVDLVGAFQNSGLIPERDSGVEDPPFQPATSPAPRNPPNVRELSSTEPWAFLTPRTWRVITVCYLSGLAIGLALLLLGCGGLVWITRHSQDPSPTALALYHSLPFEGRRDRPRLRVVTRVRRPVLLGTFRQTILIPAELQLTEYAPQLKLSLLHELAHSEGADYWFSLAGSLAQAFWFFLPPLWWIRCQMRLDHEFLADRRAAHGFGPLRHYASSLLDLANPDPGSTAADHGGSSAVSIQAGDGGSALFLRMLMLVKCPFPVEQRPPALWSWALPGLVVVAALGSASLTIHSPVSCERRCQAGPAIAVSGTRVFRVARLLIPQRAGNAHGRTPVFELPMRLPAEFELALDVWGDSRSLEHTRVVGLPLELKEIPSQDPAVGQLAWHSVHVRRGSSGILLQVDAHPIAVAAEATITSWLSVESPPDQSCRFQNLKLTW